MNNSAIRVLALTTVCALTSAGCLTVTGEQLNLLTTEEEVRLGAKVADQVEEQHTLLRDAAIQNYVDEIGARLARFSPRQDVPYRFEVIDDPDTINAFALPGGRLYVYTGLMRLCENEAQLASVMAHEIAHVAAKHHGEELTRQYGLNLLTRLALGEEPSRSAQTIAQIARVLPSTRWSRGQEREADVIGMRILASAGYAPDAMVAFMYRMGAYSQAAGQPQPLAFLSSHPATNERVANLQAIASRYPPEVRDAPAYAQRYEQMVLRRLGRITLERRP